MTTLDHVPSPAGAWGCPAEFIMDEGAVAREPAGIERVGALPDEAAIPGDKQ